MRKNRPTHPIEARYEISRLARQRLRAQQLPKGPRIRPKNRTSSTERRKGPIKGHPIQSKPRPGWEGYTGRSRWWS